jgi:hypothetical protein
MSGAFHYRVGLEGISDPPLTIARRLVDSFAAELDRPATMDAYWISAHLAVLLRHAPSFERPIFEAQVITKQVEALQALIDSTGAREWLPVMRLPGPDEMQASLFLRFDDAEDIGLAQRLASFEYARFWTEAEELPEGGPELLRDEAVDPDRFAVNWDVGAGHDGVSFVRNTEDRYGIAETPGPDGVLLSLDYKRKDLDTAPWRIAARAGITELTYLYRE